MHVIRLRHPWHKVAADGLHLQVDVPEPESDSTPLIDPYGHPTRYERSFNSPTGLDVGSKVFLQIESWEGTLASVHLNDTMAAEHVSHAPAEINITALLESNNRLVISLRPPIDGEARLSGAVTIAIEG